MPKLDLKPYQGTSERMENSVSSLADDVAECIKKTDEFSRLQGNVLDDLSKGNASRLRYNSLKALVAGEEAVRGFRAVVEPVLMSGRKDEDIDFDISSVSNADYLMFEQYEDTIIIIMPDLLPYKNGERKEDRNYLREKYVASFTKFVNENQIPRYKERVVIIYTNYFISSDVSRIKDDDNLDSKMMTDVINMFLLHDDNPTRCSKIFRYEISSYRHTEIIITPLSKVIDYLDIPFL